MEAQVAGIVVLPLGGCLLTEPLKAYAKAKSEVGPKLDSSGMIPITHTLGDMVQFLRVLRREVAMPPEIKMMTGLPANFAPYPHAGDLGDVDVVLAEPNTPVEILYDAYTLQRNMIQYRILRPIHDAYPDPEVNKLISTWLMKGLLSANDEICVSLGPRLASLLPEQLPGADLYRDVLQHARGERRDLSQGIRNLRAMLDKPIGVVLYIYQYMPDGRPVSWPRGFREDMIDAARGFDLPIFEPSTLVQEFGVREALAEDQRHYSEEFQLPVAEAILDFAASVIGVVRRSIGLEAAG